ncbi:MAG: GTPase [Isosphaerales bacterium]
MCNQWQRCATGTFVRLLTAEGRGAIAVVRVWGPKAIEVADAVFRPNRGVRLARTAAGRLRLGRIGEGPGDEVVAVVVEAEPPTVEIQCHGGAAAVALVQAALEAAGARRWRGSPRADREHASADLVADALFDLARAPTLRTAEILLDQANGALSGELARLIRAIDDAPALALAGLEALAGRAAAGLRLLSGWKVVIAGRPNVGKSRLLNALAGFPRAIVDPTPGTTRDVVRSPTSFGGWPVELADTAGLRGTDDVVESLGIERSRREQHQADLVLLVLDRSEPLLAIDRELIETTQGALLVKNKSDLPPAWAAGDAGLDDRAIATVSAERGDGISGLIAAIVERLVPDPPPQGGAVPFRGTQLDVLTQARSCLLANDRAAAAHLLNSMIGGAKNSVQCSVFSVQ